MSWSDCTELYSPGPDTSVNVIILCQNDNLILWIQKFMKMREGPKRQGTGMGVGRTEGGRERGALGRLKAVSRGSTPNVNHTVSKGLPEKEPCSDWFSLLCRNLLEGSSSARMFASHAFCAWLHGWLDIKIAYLKPTTSRSCSQAPLARNTTQDTTGLSCLE